MGELDSWNLLDQLPSNPNIQVFVTRPDDEESTQIVYSRFGKYLCHHQYTIDNLNIIEGNVHELVSSTDADLVVFDTISSSYDKSNHENIRELLELNSVFVIINSGISSNSAVELNRFLNDIKKTHDVAETLMEKKDKFSDSNKM